MSMEDCVIELKVLSCKGLRQFNFFQKLTIYALVYIDSNDPGKELDKKQRQEQKTHTDRDGDDGPEWNQEMKFDLGWFTLEDCDHFFLHFEFRHEGLILGDKLIGEVRVPLKDLIQEAGQAPWVARFVNYEVRNSEGKPNGIFYFSYRVIDDKGVVTRNSSEILQGKITGYPVLDPAEHNSSNESGIQRPTLEIQSSYPTVMLPEDPMVAGLNSPSAPPCVSSPSAADYRYYYPPPPPHLFPTSYPFPPPPPPPPPPPIPPLGAYGPQHYGPVGPEAHGWGASHPNFHHAWSGRW